MKTAPCVFCGEQTTTTFRIVATSLEEHTAGAHLRCLESSARIPGNLKPEVRATMKVMRRILRNQAKRKAATAEAAA